MVELAVSPKRQQDEARMGLFEWDYFRAQKEWAPITMTPTTAARQLYDEAGFWNYGT